jgi:hypothetical protein
MCDLKELDAAAPGGVYLCQVNEAVSCGACCGLYNLANASPADMTALLEWRTSAFAHVPRRVDDLLSFREAVDKREEGERPFPEFHHCPYIGLVGKRRSRVGCLLHPQADGNDGVDLRGLSYYGGMACRSYFCPTFRHLPPDHKRVVRAIAQDWHVYGLIITEWKLLAACFKEIEDRTGGPVTVKVLDQSRFRTALRTVLRLKPDWPFRIDPDRPASYFFEDGLYPKAFISQSAPEIRSSSYSVILEELESDIDSTDALRRAEAFLDRVFAPFGRRIAFTRRRFPPDA